MDDWFPVPSCMPLTNIIEAFSSKPKYELSIHFACGAGTYVFEDADTKKFVPITKFCDIQGMLELFEDKVEEILLVKINTLQCSKWFRPRYRPSSRY